jgi:hypothetical protein
MTTTNLPTEERL